MFQNCFQIVPGFFALAISYFFSFCGAKCRILLIPLIFTQESFRQSWDELGRLK